MPDSLATSPPPLTHDFSLPNGLRVILRVAGDAQMFSAILSAAENSHLVIANLQTIDTISTIEYILGMFPADRRDHIRIMLGNVLEAIVSQQLIPGADGRSSKQKSVGWRWQACCCSAPLP